MATTVRASQAGLQQIDTARQKKNWRKQEQAWCDLALTTKATLKRFRQGERIEQDAFVGICQAVGVEDWEAIADFSQLLEDSEFEVSIFVPHTFNKSFWVERSDTEALISVLQQCRIFALTGITGIGKTVLAERLVAQVSDRKRCRLNLDDSGITSDFATSGAALLRSLGEEPTLEDQKDPKNLLAHLLKLLRTKPYLVQIESLERLLKGNDQEGWSEFYDACWGELFQQLLAGGDCRSQLILTTQDLPGELEAIGSRYERLWHCAAIQGLSEAEQLQLFEKQGIEIDATTTNYLKRIGKLYEGHPLVLRVIAEDLKACNGNVVGYWQECKFAELEANRPTKFSRRKLQLQVEQRVKESLEQLPSEAFQLLCRSSVYRRPFSEQFWLALLPECSEVQQQAALNLLKSRALAEEDWTPDAWLGVDGSIPLRQHNLIRSVAYNLLKTDTLKWEAAERQAAHLWLTAYEPAPNAPNLETVRGYLEAFDHYCELKDLMTAIRIISIKLENFIEENLHLQLGIWGYYNEQVKIYTKLLAICPKTEQRADRARKAAICGNLGNAYCDLDKYEQAIKYHQQDLKIVQEIKDRTGESTALGNLGTDYQALGQHLKAINYYQQQRKIAEEIEDSEEEGRALNNLGAVYYELGDYKEAIRYHKKRLKIALKIHDHKGQANALGNLGNAWCAFGKYAEAIDYHRQALTISKQISYKLGEGSDLVNLGVAQTRQGLHKEALTNIQNGLEIFREIGSPSKEAEALKNLAELHQAMGKIDVAQQYCQQALALAIELGIPLAAECEALQLQIENGGKGSDSKQGN